ncbi:hypothetical protein FRX31_035408 [Thalictrum thalictroides]|uniref:Uncharacterized protein n=1 Tax=Thalictrum thalictroides TaxID=46969 RepID=A0A7J6URY2_THATH|nr:hypothetical protein FRX31_035408 [Thalictrum thalictroides]
MKNKTRTVNVQILQFELEDITTAINQQKFKCAEIGECQECGSYVVLKAHQVREKYYKMKNIGCQDLVEILDNPKYKNDRKRWQKICNCTLTKSVASSSAKAFLADSVSSSCAVGPNTSILNEQFDGLMLNVWKEMVALELEDQLKIKAMGLVHGMD